MHQYERDIFLLHGIARSDVTMDLQCVRVVHHLAASQLLQYLQSQYHTANSSWTTEFHTYSNALKSTAHQRGYPPQARAGPCASPASSSAAAAPPLTRTARWTPKSETITTNATNSYSLECPTTLTCSDRAPWPRRSSHPTTPRTQ